MEWNRRIKLIFIFILIINSNLIAQDIDQYFVSDSIACDIFPAPRNLDGYTQDDAARLWWEVTILQDNTKAFLSYIGQRRMAPADFINEEVKTISISENEKNIWDLQAHFSCQGSGEYGIETDGMHIYTSNANAGNGTFYQYGIHGTFLGSIVIPGCQNIKDMALNDHDDLIYGSDGGNTIWGINFNTHTIDNFLIVPTPCRAIAYDFQEVGFWCNNWDSDICLYDMAGGLITSFPLVGSQSISGLAYDKSEYLTPCLWGFSQGGNGAELIKMDINNGGNQILIKDISQIIGGTAAPGGLYTHCGFYQGEKFTIGGLMQNELIFALELGDCPGITPGISYFTPKNLLGYKLYRNEQFLNYFEYNGNDTTFYWDLNVPWPGYFTYKTTALYDLTPCGYPGDTAESAPSNEKTFYIGIDFILPFVEDWNTGSFDPNLWTHEESWIVSGDFGNPVPTALFDGSEIDSSYSSRLTSYWINCNLHPNTGEPYVDGSFNLEFDIMLNDLDTCGIDKMTVQYIDTSMMYNTIIEFSDTNGSFPWDHHNINITEEVKGKMIKISFLAEGEGGSIININNWYIDNINLYRQCNPPRELQWIVYDEIFAWNPPIPHTPTKDRNAKEFQGYDIYGKEGGYEFLAFTTDTFYIPDQSYEAYYVTAVYEDCEPASNELLGPMEIIENDRHAEIKIYPNPANNQITIEAENNITSLSLIDINGREIFRSEPNKKKSKINTSSLINRIYFVKINIGSEILRKKIIIQH